MLSSAFSTNKPCSERTAHQLPGMASGGRLLVDVAQGPREGDPPIPLSSTTGLPKPLSPPLLDGASRVATFFPETTSQMAVSVGGEDDPFSFPDHHHQKLPPDVA